jgi:hypothetical protein
MTLIKGTLPNKQHNHLQRILYYIESLLYLIRENNLNLLTKTGEIFVHTSAGKVEVQLKKKIKFV